MELLIPRGASTVCGEGYGPQAQRYVGMLPADVPLVAADGAGAALGIAAAVERKAAGSPFFVAPLTGDVRARAAQALSAALLRAYTDPDERRQAFDALADDTLWWSSEVSPRRSLAEEDGETIDRRARSVLGLWNPRVDVGERAQRYASLLSVSLDERPTGLGDATRRAMRDFALVGDALLVRSAIEAGRLGDLIGRHRPYVAIAPGRETRVPEVRRKPQSGAIVVWAPDLEARSLGVLVMALDHFKTDVVYVCGGGTIAGARGRFVAASSTGAVADVLARAVCIVDATTDEPAGAIALARIGAPLVTATTSGAAEFLRGTYLYEPWNWRAVLAAVSAARGGAPPAPCRPAFARAELDATLAASQAPATQTTPLVTIAIPSYNRPALLARTLASLAAQTYANIEVIVVNNGAPVDAVVAPFPFVRLIQSESNGGPYRALVRAREEMRGEYFGWLGDDDVYFPDHVSRLVFALENSGAAVAHSNAVSRFVVSRDGEEHAIAHKVQFERALDPFTIVCGTTLADGATLCRRSVFEEIGTYDVTLPDADLDWQIRMARAYDFVHVDNVTFRWTQDVRGTSYGQSTAALTSLRDVYERYPTHSAALERIRAANLRRFACNEPGMYWPPDLMLPDDWEAQMHRTRTGEHTFPQEPVT